MMIENAINTSGISEMSLFQQHKNKTFRNQNLQFDYNFDNVTNG